MSFVFEGKECQSKMREKYLAAERRINQIHSNYPEIKEADRTLNQLQKELRMMKAGLKEASQEKIARGEDELARLKEAYRRLLDRYDIPHDYKLPSWDCPHCQDRGKIYNPQNDSYRLCSCRKEKRISRYLKKSSLPKKLRRASFDKASFNCYSSCQQVPSGRNHRQQARLVYKEARQFVEKIVSGKDVRGLMISGPVGSGKSYLLGCIANAALEKGTRVKYMVYSHLLEELRHSFDQQSDINYRDMIRETQEVPLLLIDDLGTENSSEFTASTLYSIIDHRYREEKPLVISTNLDIDGLQNKFSLMGERISQRILEMCKYLPLLGQVRLQLISDTQRGDE